MVAGASFLDMVALPQVWESRLPRGKDSG